MTSEDLKTQVRLADQLAYNLRQFCDGDETTVNVVLDALACSGLKLLPDRDGIASAALFTKLAERSAA